MNLLRNPLILALLLVAAATILSAQDQPLQNPPSSSSQREQWGGAGAGLTGRGVMGTVTEVAADHFTVKTETGDLYTIHYSVNTRIMKGGGGFRRQQSDNGAPFTPPIAIKATEIRVGDAVGAAGEVDIAAKSVGAVAIFQIDPDTAKRMREMQANYGKTWLAGRVTAIDEAKVTIQGGPDNGTRTFSADENTTFRKRRDPITLADIQTGDMVRVEGAMKNGWFVAATVSVMGPRPEHGSNPPPPQQ
jgi:preprotein translocase subunit YajC